MAKKTIDIATVFKGRATVTKDELTAYIQRSEGSINELSIRQRISRYKKAGLIISVRKAVYAFSNKPVYKHPEDKFITKLSQLFSGQYPGINYCIWSSAWLYDFTVHQPAQFFYIFETEPDMVETSFNLLKDHGYKAFINPDEQTIQLYVMGEKNALIIRSLISRSPLVKKKSIPLPSLEKMLVDAFIDKKQFYFIQGKEMQNIYKFSFSKYSIQLSSLLNYAKRRGLGSEITNFLMEHVSDLRKVLEND
ncbi:MAG: DUF6577 family protein [Bacteroidales bacterium]|jgi:hypothetical protein